MKIEVYEVIDGSIKAHYFGDEPELGKKYFLEDATNGTLAQNKMFHLLWDELWMSGLSSYPATDKYELREQIKLRLGEGFDKVIYVDDNYKIQQIKHKDYNKIPEHIRKDKTRVMGRLKSWGDYTLKQRKKCIDNLIDYMCMLGVNSKRFDSILEEMK